MPPISDTCILSQYIHERDAEKESSFAVDENDDNFQSFSFIEVVSEAMEPPTGCVSGTHVTNGTSQFKCNTIV